MDNLFIPILCGTTREGRMSMRVAEAIKKVVEENEEFSTQILDPRSYTLPEDGSDFQDKNLEDSVAKADGFIFVLSEYNHSYPPSIKRMLDSTNRKESYRMKPAFLVGVSNGLWGGVRVIESILSVLRSFDLYVASRDVKVAKVQEAISEDGNILDERVEQELAKALEDIIIKAKLLKAGRR